MESQAQGHSESETCFRQVVPARYADARLDLVDTIIQPVVEKAIAQLLAGEPKGLLLSGNVGAGKSSIMAVVARGYFEGLLTPPESYPPAKIVAERLINWVTHGELINILRAHDRTAPGAGTYPMELMAGILFIDDLGRGYEDKSDWNLALQDEFFDWRWTHKRTIFATTNKTPEELRRWPGWERAVDRICDPAWMTCVVASGPSKRTQEFYDKQNLALVR